MKSYIFKRIVNQKGFSLVELMVASTIATLMSLGVVEIYINQNSNASTEVQRGIITTEANQAFDVLSRLLRQAERNSITINYNGGNKNDTNTPEISNDSITIDFTLPANQKIWPNTAVGADRNFVRLNWHNKSTADDAREIQIGNAATSLARSTTNLTTIAGMGAGELPQIVNLDLWPLADLDSFQAASNADDVSGFLLQITARTSKPDLTYSNPMVDNDSVYKKYRTYTVSGIIVPRN